MSANFEEFILDRMPTLSIVYKSIGVKGEHTRCTLTIYFKISKHLECSHNVEGTSMMNMKKGKECEVKKKKEKVLWRTISH